MCLSEDFEPQDEAGEKGKNTGGKGRGEISPQYIRILTTNNHEFQN